MEVGKNYHRFCKDAPPPKLTCPRFKGPFQKERLVFQPLCFRGHVSFWGSTRTSFVATIPPEDIRCNFNGVFNIAPSPAIPPLPQTWLGFLLDPQYNIIFSPYDQPYQKNRRINNNWLFCANLTIIPKPECFWNF